MKMLIRDVRVALRGAANSPLFTGAVVLALALGIGANTAIFSVVNSVLLRPLAYESPDRLMRLWQSIPDQDIDKAPISALNFIDWQQQNQVFSQMAAYKPGIFSLVGDHKPEQIWGAYVSAELFGLLAVDAYRGRTFEPEEDDPGAQPSVVLSYGLWQRRFAGDPEIIGELLRLDDEQHRVIGIMPPGFRFVDKAEVWTSLIFSNEDLAERGRLTLRAVGRLKPEVTIDQARSEMDNLTRALGEEHMGYRDAWGVTMTTLAEATVGDARLALLILSGAVGFVLLVACANVANLLLARAAGRRREVALQAVLGASRGRIFQLVLTEGLVLALMGGIAGLLLAVGVIEVLKVNPIDIPRLDEATIDARVAGFTLLISLATGAIFGVAPALQAARTNLNEVLKEGGGNSTASRQRNLGRNLLVVAEVAITMVVLVGAGLMIRSFNRVQAVDPGFDTENVLAMSLIEPDGKFTSDAQRLFFYRQILERFQNLPRVKAAGMTTTLLLDAGQNNRVSFYPEGFLPGPGEPPPLGSAEGVSPDYFRALGATMLRGRALTEYDGEGGAPVAVIDETLARRWWPGEDPIGKRVLLPSISMDKREVVGVLKEVKRIGLDTTPEQRIYLPVADYTLRWVSFYLRCDCDPNGLSATARNIVWELEPDQAIARITTLEDLVAESLTQRRFVTRLFGLFALLALALAVVGIYSVLSHSVSMRTREIGLRRALGAGQGQVLKLILGLGMALTLIGLVTGLVIALALTRLLSSLLYGVTATDPLTFVGVSLLFIAVALIASFLPAWRAMRVDPMVALRDA